MAKKKKRKRFPYLITLLVIILAGTASWLCYSILVDGAGTLLTKIGIESSMMQNIVILSFILLILSFLIGLGLKKSVDKIIK